MSFLKYLFNDFFAKVVSFFLAFLLWYYVNILSIEKTSITLPISIINKPDNYAITYRNPLYANTQISSRDDISQIVPLLEAIVDLSNASPEQSAYPIIIGNAPDNIEIEISPKELLVSVSRIKTNTIPITIDMISNNSTINITDIRINPKSVTITGTEQQLEKLQNIKIPLLDTQNITNMRKFSTNLELQKITGITFLSDTSIDVILFMENFRITNKVILPITPKNLNTNYTIATMPSVELTVATISSNIENLLLATELTVDLTGITNIGEYLIPLNSNFPENIKILDMPSNISLIINSNMNKISILNYISN